MLQIPNPEFNIYDDTPEDPAVYDSLRTSKSNVGIFQLGQRQAAHLCHLYNKIDSLNDISTISALLRPGMSDVKDDKGKPITERYIARRNGKESVEYRHPALEPALKKTQGEFLFQESSLFAARQVAGFDLQKADILRAAIGKKNVDKMKSLRADFVKGCKETSDIDEETANKIFDDISAAGRYCVKGDTILKRDQWSQCSPLTVEEMYKISTDIEYAKRTYHYELYKKYKLKRFGRAFSLSGNKAILNDIVDISFAGHRQCYKITIEDGRSISVTANHKFPTPNGNVVASKLKVGDMLFAWDKKPYEQQRVYLTPERKPRRGGWIKTGANWQVFEDYRIQKQNSPCGDCQRLHRRIEVHHIDGNNRNNTAENFIHLCPSCHKKRHYDMGRTKKGEIGLNMLGYRIISIEDDGKHDTYNVSMSPDVSHTFLIDSGIATCNSFNASHAASYAKNAYIDLYFRYYYPEVFYAAQIAYAVEKGSAKEKTEELISSLIKAAEEQSSIYVYPPSLVDRYLYTSPVVKDDQKYIRLGFRHVIGFGSPDNIQEMFDTIDGITSTLGYSDITKTTWVEILCHYSKKIGKKMMESMIKIGCLEWTVYADDRRRLLHEYKQFLKLSDGEVKWITANCLSGRSGIQQPTLLMCIENMQNANGVRTTRKDNVEIIKCELQNTPSVTPSMWKRMSERSLLYHPFSPPITGDQAGKATAFLSQRHGGGEETFVVYIDEIIIGKQKNGLEYAKLKCIDEHDNNGTVMVFGKEYPRYQHVLQQGEIIQVKGKIQANEYGVSVVASSILC